MGVRPYSIQETAQTVTLWAKVLRHRLVTMFKHQCSVFKH